MKRSILVTLSIGIGWILGITVMVIIMPISGMTTLSLTEILGNLLVFSFPGFALFMIAIILALKDNTSDESLTGSF